MIKNMPPTPPDTGLVCPGLPCPVPFILGTGRYPGALESGALEGSQCQNCAGPKSKNAKYFETFEMCVFFIFGLFDFWGKP
jgi:hypothetical protein